MRKVKHFPSVIIPGLFLLSFTLLLSLSAVSASPDVPNAGLNAYLPFTPRQFAVGPGTVTGKVVDARTGDPIDGASVNWGNESPETTDENGAYTYNNVPAGYVTFTAEAENYLELNLPIRVFPYQINILNFAMSPDDLDSEGQYRIIVTWLEKPPDLDAHLWTPDIINGHTHIFQDNKGVCDQGPDQTTACLDLDNRHGFGPETITILEAQPGTYYYAVQQFEPACINPNPPPFYLECPEKLEESGAQVQVYDFEGLKENKIFKIPTTGNVGDRKFWFLFELEFGLGSEISFTPVSNGDGCFTDEPIPRDDPPQCPP